MVKELKCYLDTFTFDSGETQLTNVFSELTIIGKFDDIRGTYKKINTCSISNERTFDPLVNYVTPENNTKRAREKYLRFSEYYDSHVVTKESIILYSGRIVYKNHDKLVFLDSQNIHELKTHTFTCIHDGKLYSKYLLDGDNNSYVAYRNVGGKGKVHIMNLGFIDESELKEVDNGVKKRRVTGMTDRLHGLASSYSGAFDAYSDAVRSSIGVTINADGILEAVDRGDQ